MPQLDIIYISLTFVWIWMTLIMMTQKIKSFPMNNEPINPSLNNKTKPTLTLPWT
uniref:ATP synthase F0 subunit 8 n=1 Tax=Eryx miliaris TaxID=51871 RepID=A0A6M4SQ73_ERYTA|nr:ATP synthase F0 subunit 8 [Eryx tataricus]QJS52077.1 ATP synthase F0 subunit 8 [Eryx tataricus]